MGHRSWTVPTQALQARECYASLRMIVTIIDHWLTIVIKHVSTIFIIG